MPVTLTVPAYPLLKLSDLQRAYDDCISASYTNPQQMASTLNLPELNASIALQTQQLTVTGDALFSSTSAITLPTGTTLQRPNIPVFGMIRGNKDSGQIEVMSASGNWEVINTTAAAAGPLSPPVTMPGPSFGQATSHAIPVSWPNPIGGTGPFTYSVQYRLAGTSAWQTWAQELETNNTTISNLLPNARYEVMITAFNPVGKAGSPIAATNTLGFLSGGPTNVTATAPTSTTITLNWLPADSTGEVAYFVFYAIQGASNWTVFSYDTDGTNITLTGLTPNTTYNFQVVAKTSGSQMESLVTTGQTTTAATVAPNGATNVQFSNVDDRGATVSFTAPSAGTQPMAYQLQYQEAGTSTWSPYGNATTATDIVISTFNSSSIYNVRIQATNSAGVSLSDTFAFTTLTPNPAVNAVGGFQSTLPNFPVLSGPDIATVTTGTALPIPCGIDDPNAIVSSGTLALSVACNSGHITMTDATGNQIDGSGTNKISFNTTYHGVSAALQSLVYTGGNAVANDSITIDCTNQLLQHSELVIPVGVVASSGSTGQNPPPGGSTPPIVTQTGQPTDGGGSVAFRVRDCLDRFGLNVRFEDVGYSDHYTLTQAAVIENMINYLGNGHIKILREPSGINLQPTWLSQVAQNVGAKYILPIDWIVAPSFYQTVLNIEANYATSYPNYVLALEGCYAAEINNHIPDAAQFQSSIYNEAHSLGLPALQMAPSTDTLYNTFATPPADLANAVCFPYYTPNGGTLSSIGGVDGYLKAMMGQANIPTPSLPVSLCAFGWQSFPDTSNPNLGVGYVNETTQASYILEFIFSAFKYGAKYFIYNELLDIQQGLSFEDDGNQYGLFNVSGNPKIAATAIHNMYQLLYDPTSSATSFTPGQLNYTVTGKPAIYGGFTNTGYQDALFQKSNGDFWIVMWNEQALNTVGGNNVPITVPNVTITLTFNTGAKSQVNVYDPILGTSPVLTKNAISNTTISLPPHPILVQVIQ